MDVKLGYAPPHFSLFSTISCYLPVTTTCLLKKRPFSFLDIILTQHRIMVDKKLSIDRYHIKQVSTRLLIC